MCTIRPIFSQNFTILRKIIFALFWPTFWLLDRVFFGPYNWLKGANYMKQHNLVLQLYQGSQLHTWKKQAISLQQMQVYNKTHLIHTWRRNNVSLTWVDSELFSLGSWRREPATWNKNNLMAISAIYYL